MRLIEYAIIAMATAIALTLTAAAEEKPGALKPGIGLETVEGNCGTCHSLDYIAMNASFLTAAGWTAEVTKMIEVFAAPISQADAKVIADYLARNYGS